MEDDLCLLCSMLLSWHFNPRPPCGGRHRSNSSHNGTNRNFNPRPPCGGRLPPNRKGTTRQRFQSTSSVWRTPLGWGPICNLFFDFNPRPPCGGRHPGSKVPSAQAGISIHVLRVEDDIQSCWYNGFLLYFNPRPPCGGRPKLPSGYCIFSLFQSTSSVWRTTKCFKLNHLHPWISIHVLRVEDDSAHALKISHLRNFNPRPPCGGRHVF